MEQGGNIPKIQKFRRPETDVLPLYHATKWGVSTISNLGVGAEGLVLVCPVLSAAYTKAGSALTRTADVSSRLYEGRYTCLLKV